MAPQTWMLAASISFFEKPSAGSISKEKSFNCSSVSLRTSLQKSSPSVHLLKTNLMSKADLSAALRAAIFSSVKPLARSEPGLTPGAWFRLPWPTA